jgi:hypothetical protein
LALGKRGANAPVNREERDMTAFKITLAVVLCVVGILFMIFEVGMLCGEPHLFTRGGWIPFVVFFVLGIIICSGGVTLLLEVRRNR